MAVDSELEHRELARCQPQRQVEHDLSTPLHDEAYGVAGQFDDGGSAGEQADSLDLAMPHVLRTRGVEQAPSTLVLRQHAHTPQWVTEGRAGSAIDHLVTSVGELPALVHDLLR